MATSMEFVVRKTGASSSAAEIRGHAIGFDRPESKGGGDSGPMGGEVFLTSVAGCLMSNILAALRARDIVSGDVETHVTGVLDGAPPCFARIDLIVAMGDVERATAQKILEIADKGCIMMNTLRGKIEMSIQLKGE
jgi:putative redox protein